jgi:ATP-dependent 26S proteasome regulatory subunit
MMHRFLNVGDGLVTTRGKKMIFSTNLPSVRDIDPALIRPGRCFDILNFDSLTKEQALELCNKVGCKLPDTVSDKYSIAEIYNQRKDAEPSQTSKFGFI